MLLQPQAALTEIIKLERPAEPSYGCYAVIGQSVLEAGVLRSTIVVAYRCASVQGSYWNVALKPIWLFSTLRKRTRSLWRPYFKWLPCQPHSSQWLHVTPEARGAAVWIIQALWNQEGDSSLTQFEEHNLSILSRQLDRDTQQLWQSTLKIKIVLDGPVSMKRRQEAGQTSHNPPCVLGLVSNSNWVLLLMILLIAYD